ncbi:MAG: AAA family ATPase [Thermoguttaceae bacterium]|jgi:type II secretory pathway predicted ATPase ExeA|nr:AAA family ATPase [Thermoguttaceae bacterium]
MYESFFGLKRRPFASVPSLEQYFPAASIEAARQSLARCIQRAEGAGIVVGPSGTGKTLLCQSLAEQFRGQFSVVVLASGGLSTRRALFQAILYGLGQPYRGMDEGELRLALADYLVSDKCAAAGMLLLVDEAHTLPLRLLDEIRMLMNLVHGGQVRTRVVLAGGPSLEERFASPRLASFSQRLTSRCYLEALNRSETEAYVRHQVVWSGGDPDRLFPAEARSAVYQATDGVPRLINQVCDHALVLCFAAGRTNVERTAIEEAWADLQQLPTPWNGEARVAKPGTGVIEFGNLDDEPRAAPAQAPTSDHEDLKEPTPAVVSADGTIAATGVAPDEQIERIEAMLGELEEEFHPAGSIKPEVELVFDDPGNPFSERFVEEEVVVDRFAPPAGSPGVSVEVAARQVTGANDTDFESVSGPARAEPDRASCQDREVIDVCQTVPIRRPTSAAAKAGHDELPEIVVEDESEDFQWHQRRPIATVRRHEYRQLFARLRRA